MRYTYRQRSNLPANRELNKALSANRPSSFGIRRPLTDASADPMLQTIIDLQDDEKLPEKIRIRQQPCVTLLPKRELGKQMAQGIVLGYRLSQANARFEHDQTLSSTTPNQLTVSLGKAAVYKGYAVYVEVISDRLEEERRRMYEILASIGFKGSHRGLEKPLHVTLGNAVDKMDRFEERRVNNVLDECFQPGGSIELLPWDPYPQPGTCEVAVDDYDVA